MTLKGNNYAQHIRALSFMVKSSDHSRFFLVNKIELIFPPPQVIFGLLLLSTAIVLIFDIRYNPFGNNENEL